jgi:DNA polymerase-1
MVTNTSIPRNGKWHHADLVKLFSEANVVLKAKGPDKYVGGHSWKHGSSSGKNDHLVVWPNEGRWYCSSCGAKGDAVNLLMDLGRAETAEDAEAILLEMFGPSEALDLPHLSDLGNSKRFVELHGNRILFCHLWNKWLVWNGQRWELDRSGAIVTLAKDVPRVIEQEANEILTRAAREPDEEKAEELSKIGLATLAWARKTESSERLRAMIWMTQSARHVLHDSLDQHPWLLNVENGTLDLRTGQLLFHNPDHLLTKQACVSYDPTASCPNWHATLDRIMGEDPEMIGFLQRSFGYALTGNVSEQLFWIFWGSGSNGKSTITNTFLEMLNDYAIKATQELVTVANRDRHPTELTRLFGARLVAVIETSDGRKLNEPLIKEMTGGDPITARRMREDFWTFLPTHKLFMATNHRPDIKGTDHAIWRRPRLVPFDVTIPDEEQDKDLPEKLKAEWPGILAWAVRGCLDWQQNGLRAPEKVIKATQAYRAEMDVFGGFLSEECIFGPEYWVSNADLHNRYLAWCQKEGIKDPISNREMGRSLNSRGFTSHREKGTGKRGWKGLALRDPDDPNSEPPNEPEPPTQDHHLDISDIESGLSPETLEPPRLNFPGDNAEVMSLMSRSRSLVIDPAYAVDLANTLDQGVYLALDLETTGLDPHSHRIRLMQLATEDHVYIIDADRVPVTIFKPCLEGGPAKLGQNLKFDWQFLHAQGVALEPVFDTLLADQVIHNRNYGRGLGVLAEEYLGIELPKELQKSDWSGELTNEQLAYAARDVAILPPLVAAIRAKAEELEVMPVIDLENAALPTIAWMEFQGMGFDLGSWNELAETAESKVTEIAEALNSLLQDDKAVNWNSPKQVLRALASVGVSIVDTKEETLQANKQKHPIVEKLLEYREMSKRAGTYGKDWLKHISAYTGRIHPDWRQIGSEAGRMSCRDPNLQQIPRSKDYRACFTAKPGHVLVKADYSQIEVRVAAELSGDPALIETFLTGEDSHQNTAALLFSKDPAVITKEERQIAKSANFALIYGGGIGPLQNLASANKVTLTAEEAATIRRTYFQTFHRLGQWQREQDGKKSTRTISGRLRTWPHIPYWNQLLNSPVQGAACDGLKLGLAELWRTRLEGCYPIAVIHDELIVEAPEAKAEVAAEWVKAAMLTGMKQVLKRVPVEVETKICASYGE